MRPGGSSHEETLAAGIGEGPDHVADTLEAKHRVVHIERNRGHAVIGPGGAGRGEGGHGARFGNAFLQDLAVLLFAVVEQHVVIVRLVLLPFAGVDSDLANRRFQSEGPGLIGHDGHDQLADLRVFQQVAQDADKPHGGGNFPSLGAGGPLTELLKLGSLEYQLGGFAHRHVATQRAAVLLQVDNLGTVGRRPVGFTQLRLLLRNRDLESLHKLGQPGVGELLFLVRGVACLVGCPSRSP